MLAAPIHSLAPHASLGRLLEPSPVPHKPADPLLDDHTDRDRSGRRGLTRRTYTPLLPLTLASSRPVCIIRPQLHHGLLDASRPSLGPARTRHRLRLNHLHALIPVFPSLHHSHRLQFPDRQRHGTRPDVFPTPRDRPVRLPLRRRGCQCRVVYEHQLRRSSGDKQRRTFRLIQQERSTQDRRSTWVRRTFGSIRLARSGHRRTFGFGHDERGVVRPRRRASPRSTTLTT